MSLAAQVPVSDVRAEGSGLSPSSKPTSSHVTSAHTAPAADSDTRQDKPQAAEVQDTACTSIAADLSPDQDHSQQQPPMDGSTAAASVSGRSPSQWLLFNDFAISPADPGDVLQLYGAHKIPILLYYRQVCAHSRDSTAARACQSCRKHEKSPRGNVDTCIHLPSALCFILFTHASSTVRGLLMPCACCRAGRNQRNGAKTARGCSATGADSCRVL